jgi:hypothetical protein
MHCTYLHTYQYQFIAGCYDVIEMNSVRQVNMHVSAGDRLHVTVDGWTSPGNIILINDCPFALAEQYSAALKLTTSPSFCKSLRSLHCVMLCAYR